MFYWSQETVKMCYLSSGKRFPCLHSLIETWEGLGEFSTVEGLHNCREFSQPLSCLLIRLCKYRKKVFYCFYKLTFLRKNAKPLVMALIKIREILTSHGVLCMKSCMRNKFLFCEKVAFQNMDFCRLKCKCVKKNWHSLFVKVFQISVDKEMRMMSQPCLHYTLMQTCLSVNQSMHTILVVS